MDSPPVHSSQTGGFVSTSDFSKRHSDYVAYKKYKVNLKPCKRKDIIKNLKVNLAKDSSMNLNLLKKIEKHL